MNKYKNTIYIKRIKDRVRAYGILDNNEMIGLEGTKDQEQILINSVKNGFNLWRRLKRKKGINNYEDAVGLRIQKKKKEINPRNYPIIYEN